jgi:hypothetical protein
MITINSGSFQPDPGLSPIRPTWGYVIFLSISLQEKKKSRVPLLLAGILFLLPVGLINGHIQGNISPAILCPFGPNVHFPKKFGMKSAIIGLSWA